MILRIFSVLLAFKLLWMYGYHSTDFEVHRNWKAITSSLPLEEWYYWSKSKWTLDYPPLFAAWEFSLGKLAEILRLDDGFLSLSNLNFKSNNTILFMRFTVIFSEVVWFYGVWHLGATLVSTFKNQSKGATKFPQVETLILVLLFSPALLMIDSIHFQYNSLLLGILLLSISSFYKDQMLLGSVLYVVLLGFKHIFVYYAGAFFIYLLSGYCYTIVKGGAKYHFSPSNFIKLGSVVLATLAVIFAPFYKHIPQILARLFPFGRGLTHAYWAPNFWAIYSCLDRVLIMAIRKFGGSITHGGSHTRGLVGDVVFGVLPEITPPMTAVVTLIAQVPVLWRLWKSPTIENFVFGLVGCSFAWFLFGYHVHEKAILLVLVPFAILATIRPKFSNLFYIVSCSGTFGIFPLLYEATDYPTKLLLLLSYLTLLHEKLDIKLGIIEKIYLSGFLPLFIFTALPLEPSFPFLPLLFTSIYSSIGIIYSYSMLLKANWS